MTTYLTQVESAIKNIRWLINKESIEIEAPEGTTLVYIKGTLHFIDNSKLIFSEISGTKEENYRFHYMDKANHLIKRWDSAPHHKKIKTFPFHVHTPSAILESPAVNLPGILRIIASAITSNLFQ